MEFGEFEARAREMYARIPEDFLRGIDGLDVSPRTVAHPRLTDIYTLGECQTEQYPSEFGGAGEVRSIVVLYYGSFLALSRLDEEWDWEGELYETLMHEVRHHLESLATEDELEEIDYAEDQNFARHEGEPFDPFFYRSGMRRGEREWEVDGEFFVEVDLPHDAGDAARMIVVRWRGRSVRVPPPGSASDVHFMVIEEFDPEGSVVAVLLKRPGWLDRLRAVLSPAPLRVTESTLPADS